ncbi:PIN domain-containing protein [Desulfobacterales bacterium HSG2]|nr:PIN domain-containing protein [Desulfobacterales bacterium HSG2]
MAEKITRYVTDACALIAFLQNESGGDELFKKPENEFFMHSVNLTEVCYDAVYVSGEEKAQELFEKVAGLPITVLWDLNVSLIKLVGKYKTSYQISFADAFVLALAEKEKAIVVSTDHHEFDVIESAGELSFYWLR